MTRTIVVPVVAFIASVLLTIGAYFSQKAGMSTFTLILLVLLAISILVLEVSTLTAFFDILNYSPVIATILVIVTLAIFVVGGIFIRWLLMASWLYWLTSTVFPSVAGLLYVIDLLQRK